MNETKKAREIRRNEWISYYWIDVTECGCEELTYLRGRERPIEESIQAGKEFDEWLVNFRCTEFLKNKE